MLVTLQSENLISGLSFPTAFVYILPYGPDYTKAVGKLNPLIKFSDCKVTNININMVHTMQTFNNFYSDFVFYAIV